jgi:hypothetical protein
MTYHLGAPMCGENICCRVSSNMGPHAEVVSDLHLGTVS